MLAAGCYVENNRPQLCLLDKHLAILIIFLIFMQNIYFAPDMFN
jgi:hypothetical protein